MMELTLDCKKCKLRWECSNVKVLQLQSLVFEAAGMTVYCKKFGMDHSEIEAASEDDPLRGVCLELNNPDPDILGVWIRVGMDLDKIIERLQIIKVAEILKNEGGQYGTSKEANESGGKESRKPSLN